MPRKYRPPASSRRRKSKNVEYDFPTPPKDTSGETAVASEDAAAEEAAEETAPTSSSTDVRTYQERAERHVRRDLAYVRNEAIRIGILGTVIVVGIIVAGFLR